jgi:hypothetical protein
MTIEISFDVFKALTAMRETETVTYDDVLRKLLGTPQSNGTTGSAQPSQDSGAWITKGVTFPVGTLFRAKYKGRTVTATVESGALMVDGKRYDSPSSAAHAITHNSVNGWNFWECKLPGKSTWQIIKSLRS